MKKKILIFIITYKAKHRVRDVFKKIPFKKLNKFECKVLISDDASNDETLSYIKQIKGKKIYKNINKKNLGYGGNIKKCLNFAKIKKIDFAIMLHGDGQYHPKYILQMIKILKKKKDIYAVTGSRMIYKNKALSGKMPIYKFIGNIFLTFLTNLITGKKFTDCHSGFWAYRVSAFNKIKLNLLTNGFNFDQQMRLNFIRKNFLINEVPIQTIYGSERSSMHIIYAIRYAFELFKFLLKIK